MHEDKTVADLSSPQLTGVAINGLRVLHPLFRPTVNCTYKHIFEVTNAMNTHHLYKI